jgi:hypothetical protein
LFSVNRLARLLDRAAELNVYLVVAQAVASAVRVLFLLHGRWPPPVHWASQELNALPGDARRLQALCTELLRRPSEHSGRALASHVDELLAPEQPRYVRYRSALVADVTSPAFRPVRERYGIL